ncbi:MAG: hypothetical protein WCO06_04655 [Candidatus Roizmanbacteria bacterium]
MQTQTVTICEVLREFTKLFEEVNEIHYHQLLIEPITSEVMLTATELFHPT